MNPVRLAERASEAFLRVAVAVVVPLLAAARVRIYQANIHRIGDCLIDIGFYIKAHKLGWRHDERVVVIPGPSERGRPGPQYPANSAALQYLGRRVRICTSRFLFPLLFRLRLDPRVGGELFGKLPVADGRCLDQYLFAMAVQKRWEDERRPPIATLSQRDRSRLREVLHSFGLAPDDWFVCLHVREGGFLPDEAIGHRHLNAAVETYLPAIDRIVEQGGWVMRMGDASMQPLPTQDRVVDYAISDAKSSETDVLLGASCRFWLGTNSGVFMLASTFGVPVALTNVAPMTFRPWSYRDIFIPKLYRELASGRLLTFAEGLAPELYTSHDIDRAGLETVDNQPDEIVEIVDEMFELLEGDDGTTETDAALRRAFDALAAHYYPYGVTSRIGRSFLRRHQALLEPASRGTD